MDRGAWRATVNEDTELDMTEGIEHAHRNFMNLLILVLAILSSFLPFSYQQP